MKNVQKSEMFIQRIISEIKEELDNISRLANEYEKFLKEYRSLDKYLLRVKASYLADFYMGVERIFKIIGEELNGGIPKREDWHKRLLFDMSINIGERPPVISKGLYEGLLKFLAFRHVVREIYGFQLDPERLEEVADLFQPVLKEFIKEIENFCTGLSFVQ